MADSLHFLCSDSENGKPKYNFYCHNANDIRIYRNQDEDWKEENSKLYHGVQSTEYCPTTVIFTSSAKLKNLENLETGGYSCDREKFQQVIQNDLNGSFHCKYTSDEEGELIGHVSWSCFKIKKVDKAPASTETHYIWLQITVFVKFEMKTERQVVFFIDLPTDLEKQIQNSLYSESSRKDNPLIWHTILAQQAKELYNDAVWSIRDLVRSLEKTRSADPPPVPNFPKLHDTARHVSHVNEILETAEHTVHRMIEEQVAWSKECAISPGKSRLFWIQNEQDLRFFAKEIHCLKTRSRSLSERMQNEINLAFNLVSQKLGRNSQGDNAMMKTIAVVSLVYLPGTFVSGLFGTNFFDLSTSDGVEQAWTVSSHFWLYWAITVPLTFATVIIWALWHFSNRAAGPPSLNLV